MSSAKLVINNFIVLTSLWTAFAPTIASALPDPKLSLPVEIDQHRKADPVLKTSPVYIDHDDPARVYVGPAARKAQAGGFNFLDYAIDCRLLERAYALAYAVPKGGAEEMKAVALQGPFSPFFDSHYGNYIQQGGYLNNVQKMIDGVSELERQNSELLAAHGEALERQKKAVEIRSRAELEIEKMQRRLAEAFEEIRTAKTPEERESARERHNAIRTEVADRMPEARKHLSASEKEEYDASVAYGIAKGKASFILDRVSKLNEQARNAQAIYEMIDANSRATFNATVSMLAKATSKPIGRASAAFQLWTDEQARMANLLSNIPYVDVVGANTGRSYSVAPLQVTNVRIQQAKLTSITERVDANILTQPATTQMVVEPNAAFDHTDVPSQNALTDKPVFKDENGKALPVFVQTPYDTSGVFEVLISQGAYCMNSLQGEQSVSYGASWDGQVKQRFSGLKYVPRAGKIIHQPVAINYQYFVHAEPTAVSCELDIYKFNSYSRNSGSKGALFWKRSWDDTTRKLVSENGVHCEVEDNPNYMDPEQKQKWKNDIIQKMSQELMAEYILQFADKWMFAGEKAVNVPSSSSGPLIGSSYSSLCKGSDTCQIIDIVWKSAEKIFGGSQGSTSTTDTLEGKIRRSYREWSYRMQDASTSIDIDVQLE